MVRVCGATATCLYQETFEPVNALKSNILAAAIAAFIALPVAAWADSSSSASTTPATNATQSGASHSWRDGHRHHRGFLSMLRRLNLTPAQRQQIKTLIANYKAAHPRGTGPDPAARKALREKIFALLTPAQRQKLTTVMARHRRHGALAF